MLLSFLLGACKSKCGTPGSKMVIFLAKIDRTVGNLKKMKETTLLVFLVVHDMHVCISYMYVYL